MSETSEIQGAGLLSVTEWIDERRRTERVQVSLPVRVCSTDPIEVNSEEVFTTLDASRDGIRFASGLQTYCVGMSLLITFPYSAASPEHDVEFLGSVVRIDKLSDGRDAVAVELLTTIVSKQKQRTVSYSSTAVAQ